MATIFSRIIDGELPGRFVHRDDAVVAFLSIQPMSLGHTLVVPVEEVDQWTDCDPALWQQLSAVAQRDLMIVQGVVMLLVFAVLVVNALVDLSYLAIDPRLRIGGPR